jgi:uncharacterized membrane protein YfcA
LAGAGAGGGMMMLFVLTTFLSYQMHMAVGTSVFIMTFTALTGGISHFAIGGKPDSVALHFARSSPLFGQELQQRSPTKPMQRSSTALSELL